MFSQYLRLRLPITAANIDVVRAAHTRLSKNARRNRLIRDGRHAFIRDMLAYHAEARRLARTWG